MKTWTKDQALTHGLLLLLLVFNFAQSLFVLAYGDLLSPTFKSMYADQLRFWGRILYGFLLFGSFPIIALVIKMNQDQLQKLNIDRFYVVLLIISGLLILSSSPLNCFVVIAAIYAVYILFGNQVKFSVMDPKALWITLLIIGLFAGITVYMAGFPLKIPNAEAVRHFLLNVIPGTIYEEAVYRGMLYMFLMDVGVSKPKAFYIQAFLFWITHINYLFLLPFYFWIILPIHSLIYGYIAMRSKSLTASTFAHLLYNTLVLYGFF